MESKQSSLLEQLQEKHLEAIKSNVRVDWNEELQDTDEASDACTQITLQAIVEVLEGCVGINDLTTGALVENKIEELKLLIKK